jgi:cytochrome P450
MYLVATLSAFFLGGMFALLLRAEHLTPGQTIMDADTYNQAFTLHGATIPEGALVRLVWGAANRDPREFPDADRFDVRRRIKRHLAFGQGIHFCLGKSLARLEARVAFEELLSRAPEYQLTGPAPWLPSMWARAHARVPVVLRPER